MAGRELRGCDSGSTGVGRRSSELRGSSVLRAARNAALVLLTVLGLSLGWAGAARADCPPGYGVCPNLNMCWPLGSACCEDAAYPAGSQCCQGGGACQAGFNCWGGGGSTTHCCPGGTVGYKDGGCAPADADDYCGGNRYCASGAGRCCNNGLSCCR
jgi:hypothetical protein